MTKLQFASIIFSFLLLSCNTKSPENSAEEQAELKPPLMGWASWNHYRVDIDENIIKSQADAMSELNLTQYGYNYINIDDGFWGGRDSCGQIISHQEKFPKGMKHIADYIHSKGLKAGIYTDAGINTCASYWDNDTIGVGMGLYGYEVQDLTTFLKDWDFDFLKVDWCGGEWLGLDEETRYTEIGQLARAIKPSVNFNVCRWRFPGKWVTQVADSWRISGDIANSFGSVLHIIDQNADLWKYCSYGRYNDMDILQVGRGMSYEEDKTHFTMWCMMHSPLLLGNDLTRLSEQTKEIITNKEIIDLNQSKFVYQARRIIDYGDLEVWGKPLVSTTSGQVAIALLNRSAEKQTISFELETVGINPEKGYIAKDLWSKETFERSFHTTISKEVPSHGVVVLKITGESIPFNVFQYKDKE
ncbi:glycoside hydrolase family 27 protein [Maribellus luteus]|uniref:Alpha-galactosidase n=1 Tax=Maribellus luteus TaxID=2305463 RepID=A0A399T0S0_9BACT|nr:glycoside hydrolase family 27 protein [Maribellus luteus]RIJ47543.1 glycoside hydrolase family 27 protein [Maribellus luteus]